MDIVAVGISHQDAPVDVREALSLSPDGECELLRVIGAERICPEAVVLSTCNRTEIYFAAPEGEDPVAHMLSHIAEIKGRPEPVPADRLYRYEGGDAVRHLFRVAASLDSQIVGDHEILAQVKASYRRAVEARTTGFVLNRLFHRAFRVGKRVRTETEIARGTASVPLAVVELARKILGGLEGRAVLLVGAGLTAERAAEALLAHGTRRLIVANRTVERARGMLERLLAADFYRGPDTDDGGDAFEDELEAPRCPSVAREHPPCSIGEHEVHTHEAESGRSGRAIGLDGIAEALGEVDVVICSAGGGVLLDYDGLARPLGRRDRSLFAFDIAVPRNIDPQLAGLSEVFLYSIDDLDRHVAENIEQRRLEIPKAEAIADYETAQFVRWLDSLQVVPTIKLLTQHFQQIQEVELARMRGKLDPREADRARRLAEALSKKILHQPLVFLKGLSGRESSPDVMEALDVVRQMFDLDTQDEQG
jgi:glutamyl-tRNA reductase